MYENDIDNDTTDLSGSDCIDGQNNKEKAKFSKFKAVSNLKRYLNLRYTVTL